MIHKLLKPLLAMLSLLVISCSSDNTENQKPNNEESKFIKSLSKGPISVEIKDLHSSFCKVYVKPQTDMEYVWYGSALPDYLFNYGSKDDIKGTVQNYITSLLNENKDTPPTFFMYAGEFERDVVELKPEQQFVVFACHVSTTGEVISDVTALLVTTPPLIPSSNELKLKIENITATNAKLTFTTSNSDPYAWMELPANIYSKMTDEEVEQMLKGSYQPFFSKFAKRGDVVTTFDDKLTPDTEYRIYYFGYDGGFTTPIRYEVMKTLEAGDPTKTEFIVDYLQITRRGTKVMVTPSDKSISFFAIMPDEETLQKSGGVTEESVKAIIEKEIDIALKVGDVDSREEFVESYSHRGIVDISFNLTPEMNNYLCLVTVDKSGNLVKVFIDEPIKPLEVSETTASCDISYDKYFNGDELAAYNPDYYGDYAGCVVLPTDFTLSDNAIYAFYTCVDKRSAESANLSEEEILTMMLTPSFFEDFYFYVEEHVDLLLDWNEAYYLYIVAFDFNENNSDLIVYELPAMIKSGASAVELFPGLEGATAAVRHQIFGSKN